MSGYHSFMSVALVVAAVCVARFALMVLAVCLCISARDGDRNLTAATPADGPAPATLPTVTV